MFKNLSGGMKVLGIMLSLIFIAVIGVILGYYHRPLTLDDSDTREALVEMIRSEFPDSSISNFEIRNSFFPSFEDSIYVLNKERYQTVDDIWRETRAIWYNVQQDSISTQCATVFEVDEKFLKLVVGKKLFTVQNAKKGGE